MVTRKKVKEFEIVAGVNTGVAIMAFAESYSKAIPDVIIELVQNQLDAGATKSEITINLQKSRITTLDDGDGTTVEKMKERLGNIGTRFTYGKGKIGRKNLGNLAPLGIANRYSFVSRPKVEDPRHPFFTILIGSRSRTRKM